MPGRHQLPRRSTLRLVSFPITEVALEVTLNHTDEKVAALRPWRSRDLILPGVAVILGCCLIPWAATSYRMVRHVLVALPLRSFFATCVQFATWTMIAGTVLVIWALDARKRRFLAYCVMALLVAGILNGVVKIAAGRVRPEWSVALDQRNEEKLTEDEKFHNDLTTTDPARMKADQWRWFTSERTYLLDRFESFPSGHACALFALAAFLCVIYPQARVIWILAAIGGSLARVRFERHFPEDVLVGGAIGWAVAQWVFSWRWLMILGRRITGQIEAFSRRIFRRATTQRENG